MSDEDLEDLLRRAQAGEQAARDALVRRVAGPVREAIRRQLGSALRQRVDTEDVFQSAIVDLIPELDHVAWQGEAAFVGWLATGARRRIVDLARHHGAAKRDVRRERHLPTDAPFEAKRTSPTQGAVRSEDQATIREAVERLPAEERQVVLLHSYQGMTFTRVAAAMGLVDRHAARNLFVRALRRMGELVERPLEPPGSGAEAGGAES